MRTCRGIGTRQGRIETKADLMSLHAVVDATTVGDFGFLEDETDAWFAFACEQLGFGASQLLLRIEGHDPSSGIEYFWLVFDAADDHSIILPPSRIVIPDRENMPQPALAIPDGYEHVPCFEYRAPSSERVGTEASVGSRGRPVRSW